MSSKGGFCAGQELITATRFGYAANGRTVTVVHNERWCSDGMTCASASNEYLVDWAREFRYDGARSRYADRGLNPLNLSAQSSIYHTWSDYDGDQIYGSYRIDNPDQGTITTLGSFVPGVWRDVSSTQPGDYLHNDHLGSLLLTSDSNGQAGPRRIYTAFGERITGPVDRFGYAGAWGYQRHGSFPFLHVGHRYYDPSTGRFLQRDPIGIRSGTNVYAYAFNMPTAGVDPLGRGFWSAVGGAIGGAIGGLITGAITGGGIPGAIGGAIAGGISGAVNGGLNGTTFGEGLVTGGINGAAAGIGGGIVGGLVGAGASTGTIIGGAVIGGQSRVQLAPPSMVAVRGK